MDSLLIKREVDLDYLEELYHQWRNPETHILKFVFDHLVDQYIIYKNNERQGTTWLIEKNNQTMVIGTPDKRAKISIYDYIQVARFINNIKREIFFVCKSHEKYAILACKRVNMCLFYKNDDMTIYRGGNGN